MKDTKTNQANAADSVQYEQLYAMLLEAIPSSVLLISRNLRILSANRNFLEKGRTTLSDTLGSKIEEVFPAVIIEQMDIAKRIKEVLETNKPIKGERMSYRAPGVSLRIYYYSLIPFFRQGRAKGILLLMDDVTEQLRLGEEVRQGEMHRLRIVDSASDLIFSTDCAGNILTWNAAAEKLLGYSSAEVEGRKFVELCASEERADIQRIFDHIDTLDIPQNKECSMLSTKGANVNLISWVFSPLPDHLNQSVGIVAVGRDLTETRRLEMELIQSQRLAALGVMSGGIAHEIKNPLAICSSAAQFLAEEEDCTPKFRRECVDKICRSIQRATAIIDSLRNFAKPYVKSRTSQVNLVETIRETRKLLSHQAKLQQVVVSVSSPADNILVEGEPTLLQQLFLNLFTNALTAMPTGGGGVKVEVCLTEAHVSVRVSDTGCGIGEQNIGKIFDPFFSTAPVGKGTGLGLSICYAIVQQHGGTITAESTVGQGSSFTVKLPLWVSATRSEGKP